MSLNFAEVEKRWKKYWKDNNTYKVDINPDKKKYYVLDMFPYPSGAGLHVGHPLGYIASDIYSRYMTMKGYNVLHPMGFDSFGLPAEQYAIQTGIHPEVSTRDNIEMYKKQLFNLGLNYDWSREVQTSDPKYYKWTQWFFSKMFEHYYDKKKQKAVPIANLIEEFEKNGNSEVKNIAACDDDTTFTASEWSSKTKAQQSEILMNYRLAFRKVGYVNWCEELGTVLANDEVKDGLSERGGHPVVKKPMNQWGLRITAYAERLLEGLDKVDWSDSLKTMQKNWIGKSEGLKMFFDIEDKNEKLEIFTTRPDTIFGVTFMVLSPEHPLVDELTKPENKEEVKAYVDYSVNRSDIERTGEKNVTGVFTGSYAVNPLNKKKIPIWISEYVLMDYGTGAIMAVPSDDDRDKAFAQKFGLDIIEVIDKSKYPGATSKDKLGVLINSDFITGMEVPDAIKAVVNKVEDLGIGNAQINYKLRDANFSRQRYWGEPFPIVYDEENVPSVLNENELPLQLPPMKAFVPTKEGKSPLARNEDWMNEKAGYVRESDTMPGFAGSSWYFLRYMDPQNDDEFASKEALDYWQDVDFYIGGAEHAVGHLMYSRFWHKFLFDIGLVATEEPFKKLVNQGMIQGVIEFIYLKKDEESSTKKFVSADLVNEEDEENYAKIPVHIDFVKDYGSGQSYLDSAGLVKFLEWRKEYADSEFETKNGVYTIEDFKNAQNVRFVTKSEVGKMSKRYFNVVNPDHVIDDYGADTFRMYEMFLGPIEQSKPWDTKGIDGIRKFTRRFWSLFIDDDGNWLLEDQKPNEAELKLLHQAIKKVTEDIEGFSFNTAISAMMIFVNEIKKLNSHKAEILLPMIKLIAPFAPFIAEELWHRAKQEGSVHHSDYPKFEQKYLVESSVSYPVCINGKKRGIEKFDKNKDKKEIEELVLQLDYVKKWTEDKQIRKIIVVPNKMVNIVVS